MNDLTLAAIIAALACGVPACDGASCSPGEQRACTRSLDGAAQRGFEACGAQGTWSPCFAVGACASSSGALPVYSRCDSDGQCGSASCAVCGTYSGVQNPEAFSVCRAFCQADADCAPMTTAVDVTPRCVLGQCSLFCRASSLCPQNTRCLPWNTPALASTYAGFQGLCE